jgi:hypothetical protein
VAGDRVVHAVGLTGALRAVVFATFALKPIFDLVGAKAPCKNADIYGKMRMMEMKEIDL